MILKIEIKKENIDGFGKEKVIHIDKLCELLRKEFGDGTLEFSPDNPDNFHTDFSYKKVD